MAFLKEFKEFALKGNVMDMAVGVIIGGAFGKIVSSLVNDILMPPIGALIGNTDFSQLRLDISKVRDVTSNAMHSVGDMVTGGGDPAQAAAAAEPIYWNYGAFIQQCVDFTILALCVFLMVKLMNRLMKKKEEAPAPAPVTCTRTPPRSKASRLNWLSRNRKYGLGFSTSFVGSTNRHETTSTNKNSSTRPRKQPINSSGSCHRTAQPANQLHAALTAAEKTALNASRT